MTASATTAERTRSGRPAAATTIREATFEVMRAHGMTRIWGNPGTTEIPFLLGLPDDIEFVMAMHEGSLVAMAAAYALATGRPQFVNLHTAPGLGHAINAIANARDLHAPLVVVVGQQDRKQLELAPFLSGRALERVAGEYPVFSTLPVRPQDVPGAIARAYHEAALHRGPAVVVVPMGDWGEPVDPAAVGSPRTLEHARRVDPEQLDGLVELLATASSPTIVTGSGHDTAEGWAAAVALAEKLACPVWQEPFSARAGFPEDHPLFAGHLEWRRASIRQTLAPYDLVLVLGTKAFQLYVLDDEDPVLGDSTRVAVITEEPEQALRSRCELAVIAPVATACAQLAQMVERHDAAPTAPPAMRRPAPLAPPADLHATLEPSQVLSFLAERWPQNGVLVEESPSSRLELLERIATRLPLGRLACANGGLGFGLGGAVGVKMAFPDRPVAAVLGDGSTMFGLQALWSAARYGVGVLFVVMANGHYGVMDAQADWQHLPSPWPQFPGLDYRQIARGFGCPAERVTNYTELETVLGPALETLADRSEPLLVEAVVAQRGWS